MLAAEVPQKLQSSDARLQQKNRETKISYRPDKHSLIMETEQQEECMSHDLYEAKQE